MGSSINRRTAERASAKGLAFLKLLDQPAIKGTLVNISASGLSLRVISPKVKRWKELLVTLDLIIPAFKAPLTCHATVVRVTPMAPGWLVGLNYMSIDDESLMKIGRHCHPLRQE